MLKVLASKTLAKMVGNVPKLRRIMLVHLNVPVKKASMVQSAKTRHVQGFGKSRLEKV